MSRKLGMASTWSSHITTLRNAKTKRISVVDVGSIYVVPLLVAAGVSWLAGAGRIDLRGTSEIIAGLAVITGFLFALVVFIFQLRLTVFHDPRVDTGSTAEVSANENHRRLSVPDAIDQLFANVAYSVLVGLIATVLAMVASATQGVGETGASLPLGWYWVLPIMAVGGHLILMVLLCLKRLGAAYSALKNQADESARSAAEARANGSNATQAPSARVS